MITDRNVMSVPEIRRYRREAIEGGVVTRYEVREPGERDWKLVRLFRPTQDTPVPTTGRVTCMQCGDHVPRHRLSGGPCIPCMNHSSD